MFRKSFLKKIAQKESVSAAFLQKQLQKRRVVIPFNNGRDIPSPTVIGEGMRVKVNVNLGTSTQKNDCDTELEKLAVATAHGTDTVMDLSVGEGAAHIRKRILAQSTVPVGTVPVYEVALEAEQRKDAFEKVTFDHIWSVLKQQAEEGVDFFTIHAGILRKHMQMIKKKKRVGGIVSRGGALLARWMYVNKKENPLYENFDAILSLAKKHNVTLSLGDALRPGAIADSTDEMQISELFILGELVKRCRRKGVQVMVEGPGHIRLDQIEFNMWAEKKICNHAPFYVLGPLPTDIASGYDHVSSAIGGALAGMWGADFLCVVTPAEHLRHPSVDDIKEGLIAARVAAHSVNVLRFKDDWRRDYTLSQYRAKRRWQQLFPLTIDKDKGKKNRGNGKGNVDVCSMCGDFCSLKLSEECKIIE